MQHALTLAETSVQQHEGGPFGAVIVRDNTIIGSGYNQVTRQHDPTAHAEVMAIRNTCRELQTFDLSGCHLYTSCEPCPMCLSATYWARLDKIYYANTRLQAEQAGFMDADLYAEICQPMAQRQIPLEYIELAQANLAFQLWDAKTTRAPY